MRKTVSLILALLLVLTLVLPVFAEGEASPTPSPLPTIEESYSMMTATDWLVLFGGFFGAMFLSMGVYYLYLKNKRKKRMNGKNRY